MRETEDTKDRGAILVDVDGPRVTIYGAPYGDTLDSVPESVVELPYGCEKEAYAIGLRVAGFWARRFQCEVEDNA